jgi:hypothetical protein
MTSICEEKLAGKIEATIVATRKRLIDVEDVDRVQAALDVIGCIADGKADGKAKRRRLQERLDDAINELEDAAKAVLEERNDDLALAAEGDTGVWDTIADGRIRAFAEGGFASRDELCAFLVAMEIQAPKGSNKRDAEFFARRNAINTFEWNLRDEINFDGARNALRAFYRHRTPKKAEVVPAEPAEPPSEPAEPAETTEEK